MESHTERVRLEELGERYRGLRLERPEIVDSLRRSIEREGLLTPLVANREADGRLTLLDGFKRHRVLKALGPSDTPVRIVRLDEAGARAALLTYNAPHQGVLEIEEAWVVHSLVRICRLLQADVGALLGRHKSWVCRRLALAERLEETVQDDMRLGLVPATVARELVRLPRGNQAPVAETVRRHELTCRQSVDLVSACLHAEDDKVLKEVLADPLRYVSTPVSPRHPPPRDPRLTPLGEKTRQRLLRLGGAILAALHVLRERRSSDYVHEDLPILAELAAPLEQQCSEAASKLKVLCDAAGAARE